MSVAAPPLGLMTADEFARLPDTGQRTELVRGEIVEISMPPPKHGLYCMNVAGPLFDYVTRSKIGRVMSNDSWVKTEGTPDTVRGADIVYWSYERLPKGTIPDGIISTPPDLVIEIRSPSERWTKAFAKVLEYLNAGVRVACILDPPTETMSVYRPDELQRILTAEDEFALPDVLGDFRVKVSQFFTES